MDEEVEHGSAEDSLEIINMNGGGNGSQQYNITSLPAADDLTLPTYAEDTGLCFPKDGFSNATLLWYFHRFHASVFIVCLFVVFTFYALICFKVVTHRRRRRAIYRSAAQITLSAMRSTGRGNSHVKVAWWQVLY